MECSTHSRCGSLQYGLHREGQRLTGRHLAPHRLGQKVFGVPVCDFHSLNILGGAFPELAGGLLKELFAVRSLELRPGPAAGFFTPRVLDEGVKGVEFHGKLSAVLAQLV